jgi:hypothetical protein
MPLLFLNRSYADIISKLLAPPIAGSCQRLALLEVVAGRHDLKLFGNM